MKDAVHLCHVYSALFLAFKKSRYVNKWNIYSYTAVLKDADIVLNLNHCSMVLASS